MTLSRRTFRILAAAAALAATGGAAACQKSHSAPTPAPAEPSSTFALVDGSVVDLVQGPLGTLLACTREGLVTSFDPLAPKGMRRTVLLTAGSTPGGEELRAIAVRGGNEVLVLDEEGNIHALGPGNSITTVYTDLYMILDATDLVVDQAGDFVVASATPSSGQRATNRVRADGGTWAYLAVRHQPVQLVADPLSDDLLVASDEGGGVLRMLDGTLSTHPITPFETSLALGFDNVDDDGDMVCELDGDVYLVADGDVWFHDRDEGTTTLFASGYEHLRGVAIARSSQGQESPSGYSLYLAEGAAPTKLREIPDVDPPASAVLPSYGPVPDEGVFRLSGPANQLQIQTVAADNQGDLLLGGHLYQEDFQVLRYDTTTMTASQVAHEDDGLAGIVMGIAVAPDDAIHVLTRDGTIQRITENPLSITTIFSDPQNRISYGFHLALGTDGSYYVADRDCWGCGELLKVAFDGSSVVQLAPAAEARGVTADPAGGGLYLTEWHNAGFNGTVGRYDFGTGMVTPLTGFDGVNYSNWMADGDTVVDALGNITTCSEDDWSVRRWSASLQGFERIGSSYGRPLSGVEIAPSTPASTSTTGWSTYVTTTDQLYEIPDAFAPANDLVSETALRQASTLAITDGEPRALAAAGTLYLSTSAGVLARHDPITGTTLRLLGPEDGLAGDLVALEPRPDGRLFAGSAEGELFLVDPARGTVRRLAGGLGPLRALLPSPDGREVLVTTRERGGSGFALWSAAGRRALGRSRLPLLPTRAGDRARLVLEPAEEPVLLGGRLWRLRAGAPAHERAFARLGRPGRR